MTMLKGTRFDLYYEGNKHDAGILAKLNDTGIYHNEDLYDELCDALSFINYKLPVPNYWELGEDNEAFFTQEGFELFRPYVEKIAELIEAQNNGWKAVMREEYFIASRVVYEDSYQMIVKHEEECYNG